MTNLSIQSVGGLLLLFLVYFVEVGSESPEICPQCKIYIEHPEYFGLYEPDFQTLKYDLPVLRRVYDSRVLIPYADYPEYELVFFPTEEVLKIIYRGVILTVIDIGFYPCYLCDYSYSIYFTDGVLFRRDKGLGCIPHASRHLMFINSEKLMYLGLGLYTSDCVDFVPNITDDPYQETFDTLIRDGRSCFAARGSLEVRQDDSQHDPGDYYTCPTYEYSLNSDCKVYSKHPQFYGLYELDPEYLAQRKLVLRRRRIVVQHDLENVWVLDEFEDRYIIETDGRLQFVDTVPDDMDPASLLHVCCRHNQISSHELDGLAVRDDSGRCISVPPSAAQASILNPSEPQPENILYTSCMKWSTSMDNDILNCKIYIEDALYFGQYKPDLNEVEGEFPVLRRSRVDGIDAPDHYPDVKLIYDPRVSALSIISEELGDRIIYGLTFYPCDDIHLDFDIVLESMNIYRRDAGLGCIPQPLLYEKIIEAIDEFDLGSASNIRQCHEMANEYGPITYSALTLKSNKCIGVLGEFYEDPSEVTEFTTNDSKCVYTNEASNMIYPGCTVYVDQPSFFGPWELDLDQLKNEKVVLRRRLMLLEESGLVTLMEGFDEEKEITSTTLQDGRVRLNFHDKFDDTLSVTMDKHICTGVQTDVIYEILSSNGSTSGHLVRKDEGSCIAVPGKWEMNSDVYKGDVEIGTSLPSIFHCIAAAEQNMKLIKFNGIVHDGEHNQCQGYAGNFDSSNFRENTDLSRMSHTTCVKANEAQYGIFPDCQVCIRRVSRGGELIMGLYEIDLNTVHASRPILRRHRIMNTSPRQSICPDYDEISMRWDWGVAGHVFYDGETKLSNSFVIKATQHVCNGNRENWSLIDINQKRTRKNLPPGTKRFKTVARLQRTDGYVDCMRLMKRPTNC